MSTIEVVLLAELNDRGKSLKFISEQKEVNTLGSIQFGMRSVIRTTEESASKTDNAFRRMRDYIPIKKNKNSNE